MVDAAIRVPRKDKEIISTIPALAPNYGWYLAQTSWGVQILQALGEPASCKAFRYGEGQPGEAAVECRFDNTGGKPVFAFGGEPGAGRIELSFVGRTKPVKIDIGVCKYDFAGDVRVLVRGAVRQRVVIMPQLGEGRACSFQLGRLSELKLKGDDTSIHVTNAEFDSFEPSGFLLHSIPEGLKPGSREFELRSAGRLLGVIRVEVVDKVSAAAKLKVDYELDRNQDPFGHFEGASGESAEGIAVVSPVERPRWSIVNTSSLNIPSPLPRAPANIASILSGATERRPSSDPDDAYRMAKDQQLVWLVASTPLGGKIRFRNCRPIDQATSTDAPSASGNCALLNGPDTISFDVAQHTGQPIRPRLSLVRFVRESVQRPQEDGAAPKTTEEWRRDVLLEVDVPLAAEARRESVPVPVRDLLEIICDGDETGIWNGETRAIGDEAVRLGQCKLKVRANNGGIVGPMELYGPQTVVVTVQRDGTEKAQSVWPLSLSSVNSRPNAASLTLPVPPADDGGRGLYTVEVRLGARPNADAVYRGATRDKIVNELDTREHSDLRYVARLRPRGLFGWRCRGDRNGLIYKSPLCLRSYVTASLAFSGFRFPASPRDLRNTSQPADYQYVPPRLGLLATLEPWNYDEGVNAWPANPAIQFGAHFLDLGERNVGMSTVLGVAGTFPLVTDISSQLGTKLTAGAFWENDLRGGNHLLLSMSLNIGSLLSGTQK
ncbi:hypothetical protein WME73_15125 [Sorangium sp. So ce302]|uniref:hypothetical protein n=1 Tax=Sorangium sp. So ce302 TaxID=3133297 RepID=UPI003F61C3A3